MWQEIAPKTVAIRQGLVALAVTLGLGLTVLTPAASLAAEEDGASVDRGGRLYDNWFKETDERAPKVVHPTYPVSQHVSSEPEETWRCTSCHGWDYKGANGFPGIRNAVGRDQKEIIEILKDKTHQYTDLMGYRDYADLAAFVSQGQVEVDDYIDSKTGAAKGDKAKQTVLYKTVCVNCHGRDGGDIRTMVPLGRSSRERPHEALHKILNGHPGENMPALHVFGMDVMVDILTFLQTLPNEEILASIVRGGRLYDDWVKETNSPAPMEPNPAYPEKGYYVHKPQVHWRCKECHGWDYKGKHGAYATGQHATGIIGIDGMAGSRPEKIIAVLRDRNHGFGELLQAQDLLDLANFVSEGQVDMDKFIDRKTLRAIGATDQHDRYYTAICGRCHGPDGRKILTMPPLAKRMNQDPWNALHKVLNGHPNEAMPALRMLDRQIVIDIIGHAQKLPTEK